jgi:hypothetical protein
VNTVKETIIEKAHILCATAFGPELKNGNAVIELPIIKEKIIPNDK